MYAERAHQVRALLQARDKHEAEIATILRQNLDELGEAKWLTWCEKEFGWARRQAYAHLNPAQLEKDRERKRQRAEVPHIEPVGRRFLLRPSPCVSGTHKDDAQLYFNRSAPLRYA